MYLTSGLVNTAEYSLEGGTPDRGGTDDQAFKVPMIRLPSVIAGRHYPNESLM